LSPYTAMGKFSRAHKHKAHRYNPANRNGAAPAAKKAPPPPIVGRLKATDAEARREACLDVCGMASDPTQLAALVEHGVHVHVSQMLADPEPRVAAVAAGALRNLLVTADGGGDADGEATSAPAADVLEALVGAANVMVLVEGLCGSLEQRWADGTAGGEAIVDLTSEMLQLLALLLSKEEAAAAFVGDPKRVEFLLGCLDRPPPIPVYAAHCLLILSEENVDWQARADSFGPLRRVLADPTPIALRVPSAGVLLNLSAEWDDATVAPLLPAVLAGLDLAPRAATANVLPLMKQSGFDLAAFEAAKRAWLLDAKAFTTACEILANLIPCLEDTIDEEVEYDEAALAHLEEDHFAGSEVGKLLVSPDVNLPDRVCARVEAEFDDKSRGSGDETLDNDADMENAYGSATDALLALLVDVALVAPFLLLAPRLPAVWRALYADVTRNGATKGLPWLRGPGALRIHALWTLLSKDRRQGPTDRALTEADVAPAVALCGQALAPLTPNDRPPRMLDLLGCAAQYLTDHQRQREVGALLVQHLTADAAAAPAAAALNALVDLYSGEDFDDNVKTIKLLPALKQFRGPLRKMYEAAAGDEEAEEDLVARLGMLHDNLPAFIAYKASHGC